MYQSRCQWLGDGAGTHVSVHVYRMQGEHDHELFREKYLYESLYN